MCVCIHVHVLTHHGTRVEISPLLYHGGWGDWTQAVRFGGKWLRTGQPKTTHTTVNLTRIHPGPLFWGQVTLMRYRGFQSSELSHRYRIRSLSAHSRAFSLKHWWNPGAMNLISSGFRPPCLHLSFTFSSLPLFFFLSPESVFFRNCFPCPDCSLTSTHLLY